RRAGRALRLEFAKPARSLRPPAPRRPSRFVFMLSRYGRSSLIRSFALVSLMLGGARIARAQCADWGEGFGWPGNGASSDIYSMTVWDDGLGGGPALYAVGGFTHIGSVDANYVARWDGTSWSPVGLGLDNWATAITVHDDGSGPALFVGGYFQNAGGASA